MSIQNYFKQTIEQKASDLHLVEGSKPTLRIDGVLKVIEDKIVPDGYIEKNMAPLITDDIKQQYKENFDADFSLEFFGYRFRVNMHHQKGKGGLTARLILNEVVSLEELGFNETLYKLTQLKDGLVLVTGPTGSGKSTTLAAMINTINNERGAHVITTEDPIEYLFTDEKSVIEQRELHLDTKSFKDALKYALRQDPDVIMVGEMRDTETIAAALTAAETGHLVLSTLHTNTAADTIERIVDVFPAHQQKQILVQLASSLRAIISQTLLPKVGGGRVSAYEILINTAAVANLIRSNKTAQIPSQIQTGARDGMITMNKSVEELLKKEIITKETAQKAKRDTMKKTTYV